MCETKTMKRLLPLAAAVLLVGFGNGANALHSDARAAEETVCVTVRETDKEPGAHTEADRAVRPRKMRLTAKDRLCIPAFVFRYFRDGKEKEITRAPESAAC